MTRRPLLLLVVILAGLWGAPLPARAHVGSPDVFYEGDAGPYRLFVTIRPPEVIPGVADVAIRSPDPGLRQLRIVPLPLTGPGARFVPTPDVATRSSEDPQMYSGHLWIMTTGTWQIRILAEGARGQGSLAVPVPALPSRTAGMQAALAGLLLLLLLLLTAGFISIIGAWAAQAQLPPGAAVAAPQQQRARQAMAGAALAVALGVATLALWWRQEALNYDRHVYKPLRMSAHSDAGHLRLTLSEPGWEQRKLDDLLPDHDHLMHLFLLRMPQMEQVFHLHPLREGVGVFGLALPPLPAGKYQIFADIVHATGLSETLVAELQLPAPVAGTALGGDDAAGSGPPLSAADPTRTVAPLAAEPAARPDKGGPQMVWLREGQAYHAKTPYWFRFRVEDEPGHPAADLELYMGMLGHAAFVKTDASMFAHVHPSGSVAMATLPLTAPAGEPHTQHHHAAALPSEVSFPFGFPQAGDYRIYVQIKRRGSVATGVFDVHVDAAPDRP